MSVVKYLCEFFFCDFWHFVGLIVLVGLLFPKITINRHKEKGHSKKKEIKMKFKKLLCKIFGHRLGKERHETVEYVRMNNMGCYGTSPKRRKKKKVVRTFLKCRRCGAMIMVGKRKVY